MGWRRLEEGEGAGLAAAARREGRLSTKLICCAAVPAKIRLFTYFVAQTGSFDESEQSSDLFAESESCVVSKRIAVPAKGTVPILFQVPSAFYNDSMG